LAAVEVAGQVLPAQPATDQILFLVPLQRRAAVAVVIHQLDSLQEETAPMGVLEAVARPMAPLVRALGLAGLGFLDKVLRVVLLAGILTTPQVEAVERERSDQTQRQQ
jgi:hypothetical protein